MYTITKSFDFCASHQLAGLEFNHPCMRVHGHNYKITIELRAGKLNPVGMVLDYRKLAPVKEWLDSVWDHKHINDLPWFKSGELNATAENIARIIFEEVQKLIPFVHAVTVQETEKTSARYEPRHDL